jgi:hypothetical protein
VVNKKQRDDSDIVRDIEVHFGHNFLFTIYALLLCLFALFLLIGVRFDNSFFSHSFASTSPLVISFLAFLKTNQFVIRLCIATLFLLFLNPKFKNIAFSRIIIASVVAIAGDYFFERFMPQNEYNRYVPLIFLILWCIAMGFMNYDYEQRCNNERHIRGYLTEARMNRAHLNQLYIKDSNLDAIRKSFYIDLEEAWQRRLDLLKERGTLKYTPLASLREIDKELRSIDEEIKKAVARRLINLLDHYPTLRTSEKIREITLIASRDTIRFLFFISLQILLTFIAGTRLPYHVNLYVFLGSLAVYILVMLCHIINRCVEETHLISVIKQINKFAEDAINNTVLLPFNYIFKIGVVLNQIIENILIFTGRKYSAVHRSRNHILILFNALADILVRTSLLSVHMTIVCLRLFIASLFNFLVISAYCFTFVVAVIPVMFFVSISYSLVPLSRFIYSTLVEVVLSIESNIRRYYLSWILLVSWSLCINILAYLALLRMSGTYSWISLVTLATFLVSYLIFLCYSALPKDKSLEEEWNNTVQQLSERLAAAILSFLVLSWSLIGIDRLLSLNHFKPQSDLVIGTLTLFGLSVAVSLSSAFGQAD